MYPYLFDLHLFGQHIRPPTYGVMLALAFTTAYLISVWRGVKLHDNLKHIENQFLLIVLSSIIGSRIFHVLFEELPYYLQHPWKVFAVWEGGYTLYGAMLASILALFLYGKKYKLSFLHYGDIASPAAALGIAVGRVGCFFAGCCWGKPTNGPLGVSFNHPDSFSSVKGIPLHPSQLYESFGCTLIFCYLLWRLKNQKYEGQLLFEGLICYSILRFIVEIFRGDEYRGYVFGVVSYSQVVSLAILPFAIAGIVYFSKRRQLPLAK